MKPLFVIPFLSLLFSASLLHAEAGATENSVKTIFGNRGICEVYGGFNLTGSTANNSSLRFSADTGVNYYLTRNFYMGAGVLVGVQRAKVIYSNGYYSRGYYHTKADLGLGIPFGFIFRINDHMYFNLVAPEFRMYVSDLKTVTIHPYIVTALKIPVDNAIINVGMKHNFFYINATEKSLSSIYYYYDLFMSFSVCFDTNRKPVMGRPDATAYDADREAKSVVAPPNPSQKREKIAGAFFMSLLPFCSGSWLQDQGWDWGGLAFTLLKTTAACCFAAYAINPSKVPVGALGFGLFAWPIATAADLVYSPLMVAYKLSRKPGNPAGPAADEKKDKAMLRDERDILVNAFPRLSEKKPERAESPRPQTRYTVDGINVMITHAL